MLIKITKRILSINSTSVKDQVFSKVRIPELLNESKLKGITLFKTRNKKTEKKKKT
jgi:hypothetical protein